MKRTTLLLLALLTISPVGFAACAGGSDQLIFRVSASTNSHGELWNGVGSYPVELCYDALFGFPYSGASPHACSANTLLWLSAATNAHADSTGSYTAPVCYGDLSCNYRGSVGAPQPCDPGYACIVTISDLTNAHLSSFCSGPNSYDIRVCCSSSGGPSTGPPDFHITSFGIVPGAVVIDSAAEAVDATVEVSNWGAAGNAFVEVKVLGSDGTVKFTKTTPTRSIDSSAKVFGPGPPDNLSFNVDNSWASGLYTVSASVFDDSSNLHDTGVSYLNVSFKTVITPDFSVLILPLLLAAVLFVLKRSRAS